MEKLAWEETGEESPWSLAEADTQISELASAMGEVQLASLEKSSGLVVVPLGSPKVQPGTSGLAIAPLGSPKVQPDTSGLAVVPVGSPQGQLAPERKPSAWLTKVQKEQMKQRWPHGHAPEQVEKG